MPADYCYQNLIGKKIPHGEAVVDVFLLKKFNDSHQEGFYRVTYRCFKCEKIWEQEDLHWEEPQINLQAREQYLEKNSQKTIDTLINNLSHPRTHQPYLDAFFTTTGKNLKKPRDKEK